MKSHPQQICDAFNATGRVRLYHQEFTRGPGGRKLKVRGRPDCAGYLTMACGRFASGCAVFVECKLGSDRPSEEQIKWLDAAEKAGCACLLATGTGGEAWGRFLSLAVFPHASWRDNWDGRIRVD